MMPLVYAKTGEPQIIRKSGRYDKIVRIIEESEKLKSGLESKAKCGRPLESLIVDTKALRFAG